MRLFDTRMIKKLILILLISYFPSVYAQTIKTDVLVIGGSASGVAAAIQCARSKVKTVLAAHSIRVNVIGDKPAVFKNQSVPSGIWSEFYKNALHLNKTAGIDTVFDAPITFEKSVTETLFQKMTDTVKNLTVDINTSFTTIKKDGDYWDVHFLRDGKDLEIKARVVIDATETATIAEKAGEKIGSPFNPRLVNYGALTYRTSVAVGNVWPGPQPAANSIYWYWSFPINALLANGTDNLLVTEGILPAEKDIEYLPVQMELGQGAGAVAAYCAFFKTTTKNLKVRVIQGELLDFKVYLLPFVDIAQKDRDWRAIQQVGATGLLKGENEKSGLVFMVDEPVITAEIKPVLTEIYTRAFLWFNKEKPGEKFTVGNTLSLISDYTLTDPLVLNARIKSDWKTRYKFALNFDMNRPISRREFAVLINRYLNPFARTVDLNGRLIN